MKAWSILAHALKMVFSNFVAVVKLSAGPFSVMMIVAVILQGMGINVFNELSAQGTPNQTGYFLLYTLFSIVMTLWIVVNWHRFILLEERPDGAFPPFRGGEMATYFFTGLAIYIGCAIIGGIPGYFGVTIFIASGMGALAVIWVLAVVVAVGILAFRLSVLLPAVAIGRPLGISGALEATRGSNGTIALMIFLLIVGAFVALLPALLFAFIPFGQFIVQVIYQWLSMIVGASIMTTLYGHYVEKRDLVA